MQLDCVAIKVDSAEQVEAVERFSPEGGSFQGTFGETHM